MSSASIPADELAQRISAITDAKLRTAYLRHLLLQMDPQQVADLIGIAKVNADKKTPAYAKLLTCLMHALDHDACAELRRSVAELVSAAESDDLRDMLVQSRVEIDRDSVRVPDFGVGPQVTLGERKSFARKRGRDIIARALADPNASVIRILLDNPALTESDVVRLCARRPMLPDIAREVFRNLRWIARYDVKMAIVLNPYSPVDISLQLVSQLKSQDLRRVVSTPNLPQALYQACHRLIAGSPKE